MDSAEINETKQVLEVHTRSVTPAEFLPVFRFLLPSCFIQGAFNRLLPLACQ